MLISIFTLPLFPAVGAIGLFVIMLFLWLRRWKNIIGDPPNWGWGILAGWLVINPFLAHNSSEAWLGLANFLPFILLFLAVSQLVWQPQQLKKLSWAIAIPAFPIVIFGLGQLYLGWSSPQWLGSILGWNLVVGGEPTGRMSSVFIYANFLAVYLAIAFILSCGLWVDIWQRRQRIKKPWQLLSILTIIVIADSIGLILTSSRNAWGIAFLSGMVFAVYLGWRWLVYGATAAITAILWASFAPDWGGNWLRNIVPAFFWGRLSDSMYPDRPLETLRSTQWQFCWDLIQQRPIAGWGLRNFTPLYEAKMNVWFGHPHNLFLMLGLEIGAIGTLLFLLLVGRLLFQAIVSCRKNSPTTTLDPIFFSYLVAFSGCILFNLLDVTIFDLRVNILSWILLAVINGRKTVADESASLKIK